MDKENPVRFIDAFVEGLNLENLGFKHSIPCDLGRASYNPSDLLKLYVYGCLNQVRSSRKLERECHRNLELEAVGDKGFFNFVEIKKCVDDGITPYVPEQNRYGVGFVKRIGIPSRDFHVDKFFYDKETDTFLCPAGKTLEMSYLDRAHEKNIRVYRTDECFECGFFLKKCTRNKHGRTLWRWEHAEVLDEMRDRMLPEPEKMALRKKLAEHPFGTMKRAFNQGCLLLKGFRKVGEEAGFTVLAYNIRRVLNILGSGVMWVFQVMN